MTLHELRTIQDLLQWAKPHVKTDGLYVRLTEAQKWVDRDIRLKLMDPRLSKELDERIQ